MKRSAITLLVLLATCALASSAFAANVVRISQVYGGGGNSGAQFSNDYVELHNSGGVPVDISGWSLQYGSATGTVDLGACTNCLTVLPAGSVIPACGYFLIQLAAGATPSGALPTPDYAAPQATANNLGATAGKIGLKNNGTTTPCSPQTAFVDLVGWGATANCFETAVAPAPSNSTMLVRAGAGSTDVDNNSTDFTAVAATPRNSQSAANPNCQVTPTLRETWGKVKFLYR
ncbi:MAG TPA: lamin tail domain-containing protein [Candidatus Limnocylindria bacterium]|nr:lamin tail domain-containing protein [Candidatus Limnocylindria bacterium]